MSINEEKKVSTMLTIDMNDDVGVLRACYGVIGEIIKHKEGATPPPEPIVVPEQKADDIKEGDKVTVSGTTTDNDGSGVVVELTTADKRVDPNGVVFNPDMCGNAAKPFYASGKRNGQWKKRQGVSDDKYDAWYTEQLAGLPDTGTTEDDEVIDTAGAFGAQPSEPVETVVPAPEDCGAFMGWLSAKQAAGLITQDDIGEAYVGAGVQIADIFPPTPEEDVKANIAALYGRLVEKAGE
jgi:hypothetical protein